ncbi:hypothetical protein CBF23_012800 [Marinomonas agarivorans]|nr:hypothetical protein CBF23_012800 [Marinomonas agarivorans]
MKKITLLCVLLLSTTFSNSVLAAYWPDRVFNNLDYGLYWFGTGDNYQKATPGHSNAYYNKYKKTVIFIHGWQQNSSVNKTREAFDVARQGGPNQNVAEGWLNAGYNVGILYWNQFADEKEVKDAEAKIWSGNGPRQMRWRRADGSYANASTTNNVTQLLANSLKANMSDFQGAELRITGHSLGNQLALTISDTLRADVQANRITNKLLPKRVALLDPFYSNGGKSYLGNDWTGERARGIADRLISKGIAIEAYRSSPVTSTAFVGDANNGLINKVAFVELKPWFLPAWDLGKKHSVAKWHYFWSFSFVPPSIRDSNSDGASASTNINRIKQLMTSSNKLVHHHGAWTRSPADDQFKYVAK